MVAYCTFSAFSTMVSRLALDHLFHYLTLEPRVTYYELVFILLSRESMHTKSVVIEYAYSSSGVGVHACLYAYYARILYTPARIMHSYDTCGVCMHNMRSSRNPMYAY